MPPFGQNMKPMVGSKFFIIKLEKINRENTTDKKRFRIVTKRNFRRKDGPKNSKIKFIKKKGIKEAPIISNLQKSSADA